MSDCWGADILNRTAARFTRKLADLGAEKKKYIFGGGLEIKTTLIKKHGGVWVPEARYRNKCACAIAPECRFLTVLRSR